MFGKGSTRTFGLLAACPCACSDGSEWCYGWGFDAKTQLVPGAGSWGYNSYSYQCVSSPWLLREVASAPLQVASPKAIQDLLQPSNTPCLPQLPITRCLLQECWPPFGQRLTILALAVLVCAFFSVYVTVHAGHCVQQSAASTGFS